MMLHDLQTLQELIKELGQKYQQSKKELQTLKDKPMVEASALDSIQQAHDKNKALLDGLQSRCEDLTHELSKLGKRLGEKTQECNRLSQQVAQLTADNEELLAKNEISSQRAQTILERLAALDSAQ